MTGFSDMDLWRFGEGTHDGLAELLGSKTVDDGVRFSVWAPFAESVSVIGSFNSWDVDAAPMEQGEAGIWTATLQGVNKGDAYKYHVVGYGGRAVDKADPVAIYAEEPPRTGSRVWDLDYTWGDADWMASRGKANAHDAPISVYELHLGSWRYEPGGYRKIAEQLVDYLDQTGFTHVELLPVTEHPYYGSWGYQTTGYFAATSRYGEPQDLMYFVDLLHQRGYGVLLDWVPSHFPLDEFGLAKFDGTALYEHADPKKGFHPDWQSGIYNYDRPEVRSFLMSSANFWLDKYHIDGLRVDAVASMLYLDYSRDDGEWIPNEHGGKENLGAISFLQELNRRIYGSYPDALMIAEESTAWPQVTNPTDVGGLGFGFKWDMGWMNDTLEYFNKDPLARKYHHNQLTFRGMYAFTENFMLPLSHDEVVHGKGSLLDRMPGDRWQKLANLRLLYGYQYGQPGKKLLFMGAELATERDWQHERELPWALLNEEDNQGVFRWVCALNSLIKTEPALHKWDCDPKGFTWVIGDDGDNGVVAFLRHAPEARDVLAVYGFTPVPRGGYRVGVPTAGEWEVLLCSDDEEFGGSGSGLVTGMTVKTDKVDSHGSENSLELNLPPLGAVFLAPKPKPSGKRATKKAKTA